MHYAVILAILFKTKIDNVTLQSMNTTHSINSMFCVSDGFPSYYEHYILKKYLFKKRRNKHLRTFLLFLFLFFSSEHFHEFSALGIVPIWAIWQLSWVFLFLLDLAIFFGILESSTRFITSSSVPRDACLNIPCICHLLHSTSNFFWLNKSSYSTPEIEHQINLKVHCTQKDNINTILAAQSSIVRLWNFYTLFLSFTMQFW